MTVCFACSSYGELLGVQAKTFSGTQNFNRALFKVNFL